MLFLHDQNKQPLTSAHHVAAEHTHGTANKSFIILIKLYSNKMVASSKILTNKERLAAWLGATKQIKKKREIWKLVDEWLKHKTYNCNVAGLIPADDLCHMLNLFPVSCHLSSKLDEAGIMLLWFTHMFVCFFYTCMLYVYFCFCLSCRTHPSTGTESTNQQWVVEPVSTV